MPFITEEIWTTVLGHDKTVAYEPWVTYDESKCLDDSIEYAVQVNSKIKAKITVSANISAEEIKKVVFENEDIIPLVSGKEIKKFIFVPKRLINIIV